MTLGERIKKVRRALELTQYDFGKRIGIKANSISLIESGNRNTSEQVILSICREFSVDETWLRTGVGEMFIKAPENAMEQLAEEFGLDEFMQGIVGEYLKLNVEHRKVVRDFVRHIAAESLKEVKQAPTPERPAEPAPTPERPTQQKPPVWQAPEEWTAEDIDAEAERYRQQLLSEQERAKQASSAKESGAG